MVNTDAYALQRSDLNPFLFADIGEEENGMKLSVLSGMARLGLDPWQEAARLARLPQPAAIDGLARLIATTPASRWSLPDATVIAGRLVGLLPARGGAALAARAKPAAAKSLGARIAAIVSARRRTGRAVISTGRAGRVTISLAVAAILLCGLAWNLTGPHGAMSDDDAGGRQQTLGVAEPLAGNGTEAK